ncbi:ABC transporter I family member 1 [Tanacetum coccineum]
MDLWSKAIHIPLNHTGSNGSDKSTFLRMLAGFSEPSAYNVFKVASQVSKKDNFSRHASPLSFELMIDDDDDDDDDDDNPFGVLFCRIVRILIFDL